MRWLPRLLGLVFIFGVIGSSFQYSVNLLDGLSATGDNRPEETASADEGDDEFEILATTVDGSPPEYLAFVGGIPSGRYTVAELPGSRDWDYGEKRGRTPEASHISPDNPVAEELVVVDSAFVAGPKVDENTDSDSDSDSGDSDDDDEDGADGESRPTDRDTLPAITPGLYATEFGVVNCEYELRRILDDNRDHVIGHDRIEGGRMLVSINEVEPDGFVATKSCGEWSPWSPLVDPLTVTGSGDYWIGDLAEGVWSVPTGCYWEKVVSFRGARLSDVESVGTGPDPLTIDQFTLGVRVRHCDRAPMTWATDLPPGPPIEDLEAAREAAHRRPVYSDPEIGRGPTSSRRRRR